MSYVLVGLTIAFTVLGQYFQKMLAGRLAAGFTLQRWQDCFALVIDRYLWSALTSLGLAMLFWLMALCSMDVSLAYPLLALNYVAMMALAYCRFGEAVGPKQWLGVLSIIVGVVLLSGGH